jgi:hypothetical protein
MREQMRPAEASRTAAKVSSFPQPPIYQGDVASAEVQDISKSFSSGESSIDSAAPTAPQIPASLIAAGGPAEVITENAVSQPHSAVTISFADNELRPAGEEKDQGIGQYQQGQAASPSETPMVAAMQASEPITRTPEEPALPSFRTFERQTSIWADVLRAFLIVSACMVSLGLVLLIVPQGYFQRATDSLRVRTGALPPQEKIAFLYLGDEARNNEFHIRGVVRNISTQPIEQLDANIRLYAPDRTLLETSVVRMDTEAILPDAIGTFHLTYPDYRGQFGSYSVDFKLRQEGEPVPYKDMRGIRARD